MSNPINEQIATDFQKVKVEGKTRAIRIRDIIRNAASQTFVELKEGSGTLGAIAQDTLSTTAVGLSDSPPPSEAETGASSPNLKTSLAVLFTVIKDRLVAQLRDQIASVDGKLTERYSDRYETVKQRVGKAVIWYKGAIATAKPPASDSLQQKQAEVEIKLGEAGSAIAKKEQQIKQQLRELLQTAAAKL
ncbi:hypothetical protein [Myxacorys almedinensis]|uniref:Uncharacterized protein n=1 Tax=Myxacorys almedinensis A TaxID=2690445 RepID=A0A8J8CK68_9CYAN|nr:hypothetical protein [Myxacorys almedinensis]NDJ16340.1 hypothetical protein [Myxacorys almedinensis A]